MSCYCGVLDLSCFVVVTYTINVICRREGGGDTQLNQFMCLGTGHLLRGGGGGYKAGGGGVYLYEKRGGSGKSFS